MNAEDTKGSRKEAYGFSRTNTACSPPYARLVNFTHVLAIPGPAQHDLHLRRDCCSPQPGHLRHRRRQHAGFKPFRNVRWFAMAVLNALISCLTDVHREYAVCEILAWSMALQLHGEVCIKEWPLGNLKECILYGAQKGKNGLGLGRMLHNVGAQRGDEMRRQIYCTSDTLYKQLTVLVPDLFPLSSFLLLFRSVGALGLADPSGAVRGHSSAVTCVDVMGDIVLSTAFTYAGGFGCCFLKDMIGLSSPSKSSSRSSARFSAGQYLSCQPPFTPLPLAYNLTVIVLLLILQAWTRT
eukprot:1161330-Pelagomonas_calceolata.AAC.1